MRPNDLLLKAGCTACMQFCTECAVLLWLGDTMYGETYLLPDGSLGTTWSHSSWMLAHFPSSDPSSRTPHHVLHALVRVGKYKSCHVIARGGMRPSLSVIAARKCAPDTRGMVSCGALGCPSRKAACSALGRIVIPCTARFLQVVYAILAGFAIEQCLVLSLLEPRMPPPPPPPGMPSPPPGVLAPPPGPVTGPIPLAASPPPPGEYPPTSPLSSPPPMPILPGLLGPPPPDGELLPPPMPPEPPGETPPSVYLPLVACGPGVSDTSQCTPITLLTIAAAVSSICSIVGVVAYLVLCAVQMFREMSERMLAMITGFAFFLTLSTLQAGIAMTAIAYFCDVFLVRSTAACSERVQPARARLCSGGHARQPRGAPFESRASDMSGAGARILQCSDGRHRGGGKHCGRARL